VPHILVVVRIIQPVKIRVVIRSRDFTLAVLYSSRVIGGFIGLVHSNPNPKSILVELSVLYLCCWSFVLFFTNKLRTTNKQFTVVAGCGAFSTFGLGAPTIVVQPFESVVCNGVGVSGGTSGRQNTCRDMRSTCPRHDTGEHAAHRESKRGQLQ
jgi:hypothetical protein